jgi:hypothetical protein
MDDSASSESSSLVGDGGPVAERVNARLCITPHAQLCAGSHLKAVNLLLGLLEEAEPPSRADSMLLLAAGLATWRRGVCEKDESRATAAATTAVLVFQVLAAGGDAGERPAKRAHVADALQAFDGFVLAEAMGDEALPDAGAACRACLAKAAGCPSPDETRRLADAFYRATAASLACNLCESAAPFGSLGSLGLSSDSLSGVVAAAESETGQQLIRDLQLSFLLPAGVVGVRRSLLLSKEAAIRARDFAEASADAHAAAMRGADECWRHGSRLEKTCALLAGAPRAKPFPPKFALCYFGHTRAQAWR